MKRRTPAPKVPGSDAVGQVQSSQHQDTVQLALLTLALALAVLGFALSFLWIGSLVVMGILWGVMVADRTQRRGSVKGLAAELVTTVVDEAKGVMDATSGSRPDSGTPSSPTREQGTGAAS